MLIELYNDLTVGFHSRGSSFSVGHFACLTDIHNCNQQAAAFGIKDRISSLIQAIYNLFISVDYKPSISS